MRLWTIHPSYLDAKGLVAAWREALLAQKVLAGETRGYRHHPQLVRFRSETAPLSAIGRYLRELAREAKRRGYQFDIKKIRSTHPSPKLPETVGQLDYEWTHLRRKLRLRAPAIYRLHRKVVRPRAHPLFRIIPGPATWR